MPSEEKTGLTLDDLDTAKCQACSASRSLQWNDDDNRWQYGDVAAQTLLNWQSLPDNVRPQVCLIFATGVEVHKCELCFEVFTEALGMPEVWWSDWCQRLSGHFGAEISHNAGADTAYNTWVFLEMKCIRSVQDYSWHQMRLFTRWLPRTNQLLIVSFGASAHLRERITRILSHPDTNHLAGPFWVYIRLFTEAARLEDEAVWKMRDLIRDKEKERSPVGRPQPDYRYLHDVARHAIHVTETLDVIAETISRVLAEYDAFTKSHLASQGGGSTTGTVADQIVSENMRRRLCFLQHVIFSLKQRSVSNEKRLQNELQLAFNMVAQHDAYVSVQIGRAAQSDSAATKTVAFVTLAFLPPTFVSAIFSMSFFTFDSASGWAVSDKFWIYWAFSVPITLISMLVWYWHQNGSVAPVRQWWPRRAETIEFARGSGRVELGPELKGHAVELARPLVGAPSKED